MPQHPLAQFGWTEFFEEHFRPHLKSGLEPGRVSFQDNVGYRVYTTAGELLATMTGRLRHEAATREALPAVGDWVALKIRPNEGRAVVHAILPRRSGFARKVAGSRTEQQIVGANIDTVFLVSSLNQDFSPRRIERYLTLAWESGADPVIVLSKADLCADVSNLVAEVNAVAGGVPVHPLSVVTGDGLEALRSYLRVGETVALLGSSGVGKSTLINRFLGYERQRVMEVRASDERGQHATRNRELIPLPEGGLLLDTPGMRELQLWEGGRGVEVTFDDIEELARECNFTDCRHEEEPRCAVRAAVTTGRLDPGRLESYHKLRREVKHFQLRQDDLARRLDKEKWKKLGRLAKERARRKREGD